LHHPLREYPSLRMTSRTVRNVNPLRRGFTLIEMMTTVAVLIIVLGLMVSLARFVRDRSANTLTREVLAELSFQLDQYLARNHDQLPVVTPLVEGTGELPDEETLARAARKNNQEIVAALKNDARTRLGATNPSSNGKNDRSRDLFGGLPVAIYNNAALHDAWGNPIVFMPGMHPQIGMAPQRHPQVGMAPQDAPFFFSAGPDQKYRTRDDNLYSYESLPVNRPVDDGK
jgi:prepilin-type N-terminal cleavage/methylation domain-containing protein